MNEMKNLKDINNVKIDTSLPKEQRLEEYVAQLGDIEDFMCGQIRVKVSFAKNGLSLEDCIAGIIL